MDVSPIMRETSIFYLPANIALRKYIFGKPSIVYGLNISQVSSSWYITICLMEINYCVDSDL